MAEHRALAGLKAIATTLVNADTRAGGNVALGRASAIGDDLESDAIDLNVGPDSPLNELGSDNLFFIDSIQRVFIDLHTREFDVDPVIVVENIYELRAQVHAALLTDHTLGGVVFSMRYLGTEEFDARTAGDRLGSMRTTWDFRYRMRYSDATLAS